MLTANEVSKKTGVSVRALHHYDAIGLLKPAQVTEAGYRLYDGTSLRRLQSILLFRELQFPLKEIKAILDNPDFDPAEALVQQITLLELERRRLDELIAFARQLKEKGDFTMEFKPYDTSEIAQYKEEVKARWGATEAYREYEEKTAASPEKQAADELMGVFAELGTMRHLPPDTPEVQAEIDRLRQFITEHYYHCTKDILRGLGPLYTADERFRANIDKAGGDGTADFAARAIALYCAE